MNQPLILAIDCSTGPASLALVAEDGSIIAQAEDAESNKQSARLVSAIDALVKAHGGYEALAAIAVATGPGGFTGIRIALAAARGIALAAGKPIIGVSTLEMFAWQNGGNHVAALVHAYRGQAYAQVFTRNDGLTPVTEATTLDLPDIAKWLEDQADPAVIANFETDNMDHQIIMTPSAAALGAFAWKVKHENRPAEAFYIRPPDAKPQAPFISRLK